MSEYVVTVSRCFNHKCRIILFKGVHVQGLNNCPVCQTTGIVVSEQSTDEYLRDL